MAQKKMKHSDKKSMNKNPKKDLKNDLKGASKKTVPAKSAAASKSGPVKSAAKGHSKPTSKSAPSKAAGKKSSAKDHGKKSHKVEAKPAASKAKGHAKDHGSKKESHHKEAAKAHPAKKSDKHDKHDKYDKHEKKDAKSSSPSHKEVTKAHPAKKAEKPVEKIHGKEKESEKILEKTSEKSADKSADKSSKTKNLKPKKEEVDLEDDFIADDDDLGADEIGEYEEELKAVETMDSEEELDVDWTLETKSDTEDEIVLTDAEGNRYCRAKDCDQIAAVDIYCRFHYLLYWKKIQFRKKILVDGKFERYVEELTSRYPDKFVEMIRRDLRTQKDFLSAIQELEIDEANLDNEFEEESQNFIDEVRGLGESPGLDEEEF